MTQKTDFRAALLDPNLPVPAGLVDADQRPAGRRFDVYRNNVASSLTEALRTAFPVLQKLLGDDYFTALAAVFLRDSPPQSRLMMFYGDKMPDFLAAFPPLSHLPYLPDVARLEQVLRVSYHAADATPLAAETLDTLSPDAFMAARFRFAPAVQMIRSSYPVHAIWLANTTPDAPAPVMTRQSVLILRPDFDPEVHLLPPGADRFIAALLAGQTVEQALSGGEVDFDLSATLALLIAGKALIDLT